MREYREFQGQYLTRVVLILDRRDYEPDGLITLAGTRQVFNGIVGVRWEAYGTYRGEREDFYGLPDWRCAELVSLCPWKEDALSEAGRKCVQKYHVSLEESVILVHMEYDDYSYEMGRLIQDKVDILWADSTADSLEDDADPSRLFRFRKVKNWEEVRAIQEREEGEQEKQDHPV